MSAHTPEIMKNGNRHSTSSYHRLAAYTADFHGCGLASRPRQAMGCTEVLHPTMSISHTGRRLRFFLLEKIVLPLVIMLLLRLLIRYVAKTRPD